MPILENLRKALGLDNEISDDRDMELPWEEDFSPLGGGAQVPDTSSLNMPRLVDALRRLYAALDADTRKAVSDGELPELPVTPQPTAEGGDAMAQSADYARLEEQKRDADNKLRAMQNRVAELERRLAEASKTAPIEPMPQRIAQVGADREVKRLQTLNEQLTAKSKISDQMLSETKRQLAEKRKEAEELSLQLEAARKRINELETANSDLKAERKELKETIESNLYNQALNENQLRQRIKQLEGSKTRRRGKANADKRGEETSKNNKSSLDRAMDATNWIDGTPEKPADEEFGYQEPKKTTTPDPDEQLFLF